MNEQNFDYLRNQLKYTGFGDLLQRELRAKMSGNPPQTDFTILFRAEIGDDPVETVLQFRKSENAELYFFNRFSLQIKNGQGTEPHIQSFRIGRENNITLKEAYNLLKGRSVYKEVHPKEGEKYHAWLQLNFKETNEHGNFKIRQYHPNYGFDLKQVLERFEIKELENPETNQSLIRSLEKGNRQAVSIRYEGKEEKMFIEASPQYKSVNIYNNRQLRINIHSQGHAKKESQKQNETSKEKQRVDPSDAENQPVFTIEKRKRIRIRKQGIS
jgi:hypothetical protein